MRLHCGQKCSSTGAPAPHVRHSSGEIDLTEMGSGDIFFSLQSAVGSGLWPLISGRLMSVWREGPNRAARRVPPTVDRSLRTVLHAPNELPQPHVCFAFGLLNTKPLLSN